MNLANRNTGSSVKIISRSREPFQSRLQAGELLARELAGLQGKNAVVLGIPRGGIIIAQALARKIEADLDIVLSRKLGALGQPELAMGAVDEKGEIFLNREVVEELFIPEIYIEQEKERQMEEIRRRSRLIRQVLPKVSLAGRIAVVTDDGVATGATMQAAIWAIRHENPQKLIAAIPVASEEAVAKLSGDVDQLICWRMPPLFMAVGQFYREFDQVTDEEVLAILNQERQRKQS